MSVLIKGMEMPKDKPSRIVLNPNGQLFVDHGTWYTEYEAVEIPPHGRLIDADSVEKQIDYVANLDWNRKVGASGGMLAALEIVEDALTIIESEGEDESR